MVKPMKLEASAAPGRVITLPLEVRNTAGSEVRGIDLRLVGLSQNPDGSWKIVEDISNGIDPYSALPWTTFDQANLEIAPLRPAEVQVRLSPPPDARGVYYAAVLAETRAPESSNGVAVRIRFLIPLIVEIAGRPVRQNVAISDVDMALVDQTIEPSGTTTASLLIANEGRTYSRIKGMLTVDRKNGDSWRPVTRLELPDRAILPGLTLALGGDMKRRLPSGLYRLRGELMVDGRRVVPVVKEIAFEGDPNVDSIAYDTALLLTPETITMDVLPGATRATTLTIENPGTDPVDVLMSTRTPIELGGVQMGDLMGVDLSAEPWTEIRPASFTIRPGRRQSVRVISRIPDEGIQYPNYYADLVLEGVYANGQSAGTTHSTIHLANSDQGSTPDVVVEQLELEQGESPTGYFVQARIANVGNVDILPLARVYLMNARGTRLRNVALSGEDKMLLPLSKRTYSADLDLGGLEPGYYAVRSVFGLEPGKEVTRQLVIRLDLEEHAGADGETTFAPVVSIDENAPEISLDTAAAEDPVVVLDAPQEELESVQ